MEAGSHSALVYTTGELIMRKGSEPNGSFTGGDQLRARLRLSQESQKYDILLSVSKIEFEKYIAQRAL
jgi:hypothetical protein